VLELGEDEGGAGYRELDVPAHRLVQAHAARCPGQEGVSPSALANIPRDPNTERYIFNGEVPPPLAKDLVRGPAGPAMQMTWRLLGQEPVEVPGGRVRIVDSTNFPAASTIAAALVELDPGAMRELHWHPNNDWQCYISGQAKMTVSASSGKARTFDYQATWATSRSRWAITSSAPG